MPKAALTAITQVTSGDVALAALTTTTTCTVTISAPAMATPSGIVHDSAGHPLRAVEISATPTGVLAGLPPMQTVSTATGAFTLSLAAGGSYDLRFVDPSGAGGVLTIPAVGPAGVPAIAKLPAPIHVYGDLLVGPTTVTGAAVEMLCTSCAGLAAVSPIATAVSDATGHFTIAVPDPGSM